MDMTRNVTAVIQAGGRGTRMRELTGDRIPKPMLPLNGKPVLQWQIEGLAEYGIREFVVITGHLGGKIREYFGDGSRLDVRIRYIEETEPLGSAGALSRLRDMEIGPWFLLVFGDVVFSLDWDRMLRFHEERGGKATVLAHPNAHPYDSDLLILDGQDRALGIDSKHNTRDYWYDNCVNAGLYVLSAEILRDLPEGRRMDLEQDILAPLMEEGSVFGYRTPEYVKDTGTVERFRRASQEQLQGVWERKNLRRRQRCVFLDRDGTVNRYNGLISREEQFELEEGAARAVRMLNEAGYLAIVVTNQPVVARGLCDLEAVRGIHRKMQTLLGREGAYLDDIAFCPHHPDRGYPEENPAYKIACACRKPATGMIDGMVEKYHIDVSRSFMVGDSTVDIQTGKNAGLKTVLLSTGQAGRDGKYGARPDRAAKNLVEAVSAILKGEDRDG